MKQGVRLSHLSRLFDVRGITDLFDSFVPSEDQYQMISRLESRLDRNGAKLLRFLTIGDVISDEESTKIIGEELCYELSKLGLLTHHDGKLRLSGLSLHRYRGVWFFSDVPQPSPTLYFGADSIALASRLSRGTGHRALDLCAGPGIQTLVLASLGYVVDSIDINPFASRLCEINASCNSLSDNVIVRTGDLFSPLGPKETFDVIVANPPLLPIPEGIPYPFVGDGGPDGLTVVRRIIAGMRGRLTNQGQFLMVGMSCRDDFSILSTSELSDMLSGAGLAGLMTVISSYGIGDTNPWISGVALTSKAHSPQSAANIREIKERLVREYAQQGATAVCTYVLRAWPSACPKLTVRDYSGDNNDRAPWIMT